ncbi:hypothetical protein [Ruegeria sp. SCP11]|uniref:hypothetical protein n=1 Tax=Ruegeria sp. SCP11 TaxID=3141378 RepID=UPI003339DBCC
MSLLNLIASFDDDALVALASKGLLRRASKTVGDALITQIDEGSADVEVGDHKVSIPRAGPQQATCDCPAPGVCSHILTAMLALRERLNQQGTDSQDALAAHEGEETTPDIETAWPIPTAVEDIAAIGSSVLRKFAGADYSGALVLAGSVEVEDRGSNVAIKFSAPEATVTFVAGQSLNAALYKGPTSRKRLAIAAAAQAIRDRAGVKRDAFAVGNETAPALADDILQATRDAIEAAVPQVFRGSPSLAQERLFDLAISTKVQSAPRLTALLMSLSVQAGWAYNGDIRFDGGQFLGALANAYGLVEALRKSPNEVDLLGAAKRKFAPAESMDLWVLGSTGWTSISGARGLTVFLLNPDTGRFHTATLARGAGMDGTFTPSRAYESPLWGVSSVAELSGKAVTLSQPLLAQDGQLSTSEKTQVSVKGSVSSNDLQSCMSLIREWTALRVHLRGRIENGLKRGAVTVPALIAPTAIKEPLFDDVSQRYSWQIQDQSGAILHLSARPQNMENLKNLHAQFSATSALLIESSVESGELVHRPVSLLQPNGSGIKAVDLYFQASGDRSILSQAKARALRSFLQFQGPKTSRPQTGFAAEVLNHLAETCRHLNPETLSHLAKRAEARQLPLLAQLLERSAEEAAPRGLLAAAYICTEITMAQELGK